METRSIGGAGSLDVNDLESALDSVNVVHCGGVQLRIAGLSLAGGNLVASAVLPIYAALAAVVGARSTRPAAFQRNIAGLDQTGPTAIPSNT
jgi:hypothetical protein